LRQRLVEPAELGEPIAAIDQRAEVRGRKRHSPLEGGERFGRPMQPQQQAAASVVRIGIVGLQGERLVEARKRLALAIEHAEREPAIRPCIGTARIDLEGGLDPDERSGRVAALQLGDTEQMKGLVIVGQHLEDAAADLLGFVQPALPEQVDRSREQLRDLGQRS
jgi:hypothetical protein